MNPELLAMLLDYLRTRDTSGAQDMGGEIPYDDYNMQGTIGGLGAYDGPVAEDWADTGISGSGWGTGANANSATQPYFAPPEMAQYSGGRPLGTPVPGIARLLHQMQQGADYGAGSGMQGLFGGGGPQIERPRIQAPVTAPVTGMNSTAPYGVSSQAPSQPTRTSPAPSRPPGTMTPTTSRTPGYRAPHAAQAIASAARNRAPAPGSGPPKYQPSKPVTVPYRAPAPPTSPARTVNPVGAARNIMKPRSR